jgi:hypothetical protein
MGSDLVLEELEVLGEVVVDGFCYRIHRAGFSEHEVVRSDDGRRIGRLRGSPSSMWLLEAEDADEEDLLHIIVRAAIEEGFFADLPTD